MTIKYMHGNILNDKSHAIVIPVNTIGVAGAGLARQWAIRYPKEEYIYSTACRKKQLTVGAILPVSSSVDGHIFLCFPTKIVPQMSSDLAWIEGGLSALKRCISARQIKSVAIPALGCGLGGLSWEKVKPLIESHLGKLSIRVNVYPPK